MIREIEKFKLIHRKKSERVTVQRTIMWLYPEDLLVLRLHIS
uniref:Uncharacterized protein n=1 Tax=Setaria italica TaxID=4555 RepID=K4AI18_SETIT